MHRDDGFCIWFKFAFNLCRIDIISVRIYINKINPCSKRRRCSCRSDPCDGSSQHMIVLLMPTAIIDRNKAFDPLLIVLA